MEESHFAKISLLESQANGLLPGSLDFHEEVGGTLEAPGEGSQSTLVIWALSPRASVS